MALAIDLLLYGILFNIFILKKILTNCMVESIICTKIIGNNSSKLLYNSKVL